MGTSGSLGVMTGRDTNLSANAWHDERRDLKSSNYHLIVLLIVLTTTRTFRVALRREIESRRYIRSEFVTSVLAVRWSSKKLKVRGTGSRKRLCRPSGS